MEYITTTQLRTQSVQLVKQLAMGLKIQLVHRSRVVGSILPKQEAQKIFNRKAFYKSLNFLPKKLLPQTQREKTYRKHLMEKYG